VRLVIEQGVLAGQSVPLEGGAILVGRGGGSDLRLPEAGVSRQHVRFQRGTQGWMVVDLGSTNGTFVNAQRLQANQPYLLRLGDRIAIGGSVFVVESGEPGGAVLEDVPQQEPPARSRPHPALLMAGAAALVVVLVGIVILVVTLLQAEPEPVTPTVAGPLDQIATVFPVPTGLQEVMTAVVPLLPTGFPVLPSGPTAPPTPKSALPGREMAQAPMAPVPVPEPSIRFERGDAVP
jgi:pSer/pThr/pTyr-binding forkhead associated (FHA) protein